MMSCENSYLDLLNKTTFQLETIYIDEIRGDNDTAFTRKRKVLLPHIFMQMLTTTGVSQKNEISEFYSQVGDNIEISQIGYFKARMKFNPDALRTILHDINKQFYALPDRIKLNDYFITAIDGSDFLIPRWRDNKDIWNTKLNETENDPVMGSASSIFDVINKCILDIAIKPYKFSEKSSAGEHLDYVRDILPRDSKMLCIFDRGYPSIKLIDRMLGKQFFVLGLKSTDLLRECAQLNENDKWIDITYDCERSNDYRDDKKFRIKLMNTVYHLRFVRFPIPLDDGRLVIETLLTNLPESDFDTEAMRELYPLRWDIETCYRSMKSQLKMEELSGYRERLIKQDIYACVLVYNAISDVINMKCLLIEIMRQES